jgi:hypothetical protein
MTEETAETAASLPDVTKGWGLSTFTLKHPFVFRGGARREIQVRIPSGADIEAYVRSPERGFRALAVKLADIDEAALDALHGSDYARLMAFVGEFVAGTR